MLLLFSHSFTPDSLPPHGLQHTKLPCPSPSLRIPLYSCPLSRWSYPNILFSVIPSPAFNLSQHKGKSVVVIQLLNCVWLFTTPWTAACRLLCPSLSPRVCSNSCPLSQWCCLIISSSAAPFFSLQSFPAWGSFPVSWLFTSGGQNIGASALASVLSMNIQGWFPLGLTGFISFQSKGLSGVLSSTKIWNYQFFGTQPSSWSNSHIHTWLLEKP